MNCQHYDEPTIPNASAGDPQQVACNPGTVVRSSMEQSTNSTAKMDGIYWLVVMLTLDRILQAFGVY